MKPEVLKEHIKKLGNYFREKRITKPFGVNIPLTRGDTKELVRVTIEAGVKIVFTSAGHPKVLAGDLKAAGMTLVHVVPSVKHALKAQDVGCDAVVAEGFEAGGHNGVDEITTFCLVPQVADAVEIPVIAAGGIATGRQILSALALGAEGVQIGTRFAATFESSGADLFKQKIVEANDSSTILTLKKVAPVRLFKNKFGLEADKREKSGAQAEELKEFLGRKREMQGIFEGNLDEGELEMGQSSGLVKEIKSVKEVITDLMKEYLEAKSSLPS